MNKTIIININGSVFHIEEEAYDILQGYMTEIKRHFAYSADSEEIVTDIENRLAEMFSERLAELKSEVVTLNDVNEIIARMGSARDFDQEEELNEERTLVRNQRKLFRDTDDSIIGGVCAGLAHYFNTEARWIRLIAFIVTLLWGTGLIIYGILWIIVPAAKSRADKMAMKGEPLTLQNFKRNFEREMDNISPGLSKATNAVGSFLEHLGVFVTKLVAVLVKIVGAFIIAICFLSLIGILIGLIGTFSFWSSSNFNAMPFGAVNPEYRTPLFLSAFLLTFIPFLALLFFTLRVIFNKRIIFGRGSFVLLILWIVGLIGGVYYGARFGSEFSQNARIEQRTELVNTPVLYIGQNEEKFLSSSDSAAFNILGPNLKGQVLLDDDKGLNMEKRVELYIERSSDGKLSITKQVSSRGKNYEDALKNAQSVYYRFAHTDSTLTLNRYFSLKQGALIRGQEIKLTLRVPQSTKLVIDANVDRILRDYDLNVCRTEKSDWSQPTHWIMTEEGMKCDTLVSKIPVR